MAEGENQTTPPQDEKGGDPSCSCTCGCGGSKGSRWASILILLLLLIGLAVWRFTQGGCPLNCGDKDQSCGGGTCVVAPAGSTRPAESQSQPATYKTSDKAMKQQYRH